MIFLTSLRLDSSQEQDPRQYYRSSFFFPLLPTFRAENPLARPIPFLAACQKGESRKVERLLFLPLRPESAPMIE